MKSDSKTERQSKERLRSSKESNWQIASNIPGIVYQLRVNKDGSFSFPFISEGVNKMLGYTSKEVHQDPENVLKSMMEGTPYSIEHMIRDMQKTSHTLSLELQTTDKNGETKWIRNVANPNLLENGDVVWNGVIIDITEQRLVQEALRESEQRYREVFDHTSDAIFIVDVTAKGAFRFSSYNAIAREIIGQTPNAIPGGLIEEYFNKELAGR